MVDDSSRGTVLVTGAAGCIGSHVSEALLQRGQAVLAIDNFDDFYPRAMKERNVADIRTSAAGAKRAFTFIEGDITDVATMRRLFEQHTPTSVIHLAAKAGPRVSVHDPVGYAHANVTGTAVVLDEARRAGVVRMVIASSSSVYGNCTLERFPETFDACEPVSPYAASKRACELMGFAHWTITKMPTALLRFFTVYGPRQRPDLGAALFLRKIGAGETIDMFGDGTMARDATYIDDIVRGVLAAHDRIDRFGYRLWNLGGDSPVALTTLIAACAKACGREPIINHKPMQPGDVHRTAADLTRSRAELDFTPTVSLDEGLKRQWAWMNAEEADRGR